jgi:predicted subunit of tRNA(5-methylaminomethyl-2-thiouridylate) methyltransferase
MCDLGLALTLGSTLLGAAGQVQQAKATAEANKYNAQVAEMNAEIADKQAKDATERGKQEEQQKRLQTAQLEGRQKAAIAANGIDLSFGSPLDTIVDTAKMGEIDALNVRTNAYREAYGYKVQGTNHLASAKLDRMRADAAVKGGYLDAVGTILGGTGKVYTQGKALGYFK